MKYVLPNTLQRLEMYEDRWHETFVKWVNEPNMENWKAWRRALTELNIFKNRYRVHIERSKENEEVIR